MASTTSTTSTDASVIDSTAPASGSERGRGVQERTFPLESSPLGATQAFHLDPDDDLFTMTGGAPVLGRVPMGDSAQVSERMMIVQGAATPVTMVGGLAIGEVAWSCITVYMAQLRLDPTEAMRSNYDFTDDPKFPALKESIRQTGINLEPLLVQTTQEQIEVDGIMRPVLDVRSGTRRYCALKELGRPDAQVRVLPQDMTTKGRVLLGLMQNELREPLPLLDRCDIVWMLINEHKMSQTLVAQHVGYSQSQVWRMEMAAQQPPQIRTYLANDDLTLDAVEKLNGRLKEPRTEERILAARYVVQEGLQRKQIEDFLNEVYPVGGLTPRFLLVPAEAPRGGLVKVPAQPASAGETPAAGKHTTPYWRRAMPIVASPVRILRQVETRTLLITPTRTGATVELTGLGSRSLYRLLEGQRVNEVDIARLEETLLADLEAVRRALDERKLLTTDGLLVLQSVVDADVIADAQVG